MMQHSSSLHSPIVQSPYQKSRKLKLRVGQFNVCNLVKEGVKFYDHEIYSKSQVDKKVSWIANQLKKMNSQIVGFEEVFHADVLMVLILDIIHNLISLKRAINESGIYTSPQLVCFGADGTAPRVALVSSYPVIEQDSIEHFPKESLLSLEGLPLPITRFSRPVSELQL